MTASASSRAGVLFDVDGTLVDSTYLHTLAWWQAFRQADHDVAMAVLHRSIGMGADKILDHILGEDRDRSEDDTVASAHDAIYSTHWPALRAFPQAAELLRRTRNEGLGVVLASSAKEKELGVLRTVLNADDAIDAATSSSDVKESKPAPDILEAALAAGKLDRDSAVFVGDAVWDVQASAKLGIRCVGLECGGTSAAELRDAGAVAVYRDPAALLADFGSSPLTALLGR